MVFTSTLRSWDALTFRYIIIYYDTTVVGNNINYTMSLIINQW